MPNENTIAITGEERATFSTWSELDGDLEGVDANLAETSWNLGSASPEEICRAPLIGALRRMSM